MGNSSSKQEADGQDYSAPSSPSLSKADGSPKHPTNKTLSRRPSNIGKTTAAPPSASYESALAQPAHSHTSSSLRPRSQTAAPALGNASGHSINDKAADGSSKSSGGTSTPQQPLTPATDAIATTRAAGATGQDVPTALDLFERSPSEDNYYITPSQFGRPPRLPLPIDEEVLSPGSPILTAADLGVQPDSTTGKSVVLSSTNLDDENATEEGMGFGAEQTATTPTVIQWRQGGNEVYVTGTFIGWNRKYKLHKDGPIKEKGVHSATINLPPGTHHITFLVDNDMHTSKDLPTAVDFTNALVNWIEVPSSPSHPAHAEPRDIPQRKQTGDRRTATGQSHGHPSSTPDRKSTPDTVPPAPTAHKPEAPKRTETPKPRMPPKVYHSSIPRMLLDLDAPESSTRFSRANTACMTHPQPPSLPMMLNKSILNGATPMKDDASVLIMPNHTVLNHLATSSIKYNVLATSATTRYKKKFLTTIMYKPTNDTGE